MDAVLDQASGPLMLLNYRQGGSSISFGWAWREFRVIIVFLQTAVCMSFSLRIVSNYHGSWGLLASVTDSCTLTTARHRIWIITFLHTCEFSSHNFPQQLVDCWSSMFNYSWWVGILKDVNKQDDGVNFSPRWWMSRGKGWNLHYSGTILVRRGVTTKTICSR